MNLFTQADFSACNEMQKKQKKLPQKKSNPRWQKLFILLIMMIMLFKCPAAVSTLKKAKKELKDMDIAGKMKKLREELYDSQNIEEELEGFYDKYIKDIGVALREHDKLKQLLEKSYGENLEKKITNPEQPLENEKLVEEFFESMPELPVTELFKKACNENFFNQQHMKGGNGAVIKVGAFAIKRMRTYDIDVIPFFYFKREVMLSMISNLYYPRLFSRTYGIFQDNNQGYYYIIMDYNGVSLSIPVVEANLINLIEYFNKVIQALKHLYFNHHDLKSENILYDKIEETLQVIDFGFASFHGMDEYGKYDIFHYPDKTPNDQPTTDRVSDPIEWAAYRTCEENIVLYTAADITLTHTSIDSYALGMIFVWHYVENKKEHSIIKQESIFSYSQNFEKMTQKQYPKKIQEFIDKHNKPRWERLQIMYQKTLEEEKKVMEEFPRGCYFIPKDLKFRYINRFSNGKFLKKDKLLSFSYPMENRKNVFITDVAIVKNNEDTHVMGKIRDGNGITDKWILIKENEGEVIAQGPYNKVECKYRRRFDCKHTLYKGTVDELSCKWDKETVNVKLDQPWKTWYGTTTTEIQCSVGNLRQVVENQESEIKLKKNK